MPELDRNGMIKANLAAINVQHRDRWSFADMVKAAVEAYVIETSRNGRLGKR